jgi:outer membrane protein OmpA-like peptidoglycan-associated protein
MTAIAVVMLVVIGQWLWTGNSATTVILIPDRDGQVGAITVSTPEDARVIDQAYHSVTAADGASRLPDTRVLSEAAVLKEYADLLDAQPANPLRFTLYFVSGSADLTEASQALIPRMIDEIKASSPVGIGIYGHTDSTGSDAANNRISLERAQTVEALLRQHISTIEDIHVQSLGSKEPLVPTPPNVDEPRNRRVEILTF